MTRLIDADVLPRHGNRGGIVQWHDIEKASTVDAIPIEWLEGIIGMLKMHYEFGNEETREPSYYGINALQSVINGWREHETD